jgi:peptide chain release factor subunit 1
VTEVSSEDFVEGLFRRAGASGAVARLVSSESEEGEMLVKGFGGIGAILRYPIAATPALRPRPPK